MLDLETPVFNIHFLYLSCYMYACCNRSEIVHAMMNLLLRYWDLIKHTLVLLSTPSFCEAFKIHAYTYAAMMT